VRNCGLLRGMSGIHFNWLPTSGGLLAKACARTRVEDGVLLALLSCWCCVVLGC
jgi:hypothetical protein